VFEPSHDTQKLLARFIDAEDLLATDYLFTSTRPVNGPEKPLSERAYLNLVKNWVAYAGLNPEAYGTHSIRRARPALIYRKTGNIRACQIMLGHKTIASTQLYLGVEEDETLDLARQFEM
jgi:site-specific recombinase XerD